MLIWTELSDAQKRQALSRPAQASAQQVNDRVKDIINTVAQKGDAALFEYTRQFDGAVLNDLYVSAQEFAQAESQLNEALICAMQQARQNIQAFHQAQQPEEVDINTMPGVRCQWLQKPIRRVGLYIPGGTAPLPSTVMMLAIPAKLAGCESITLTTPAGKDGNIAPSILYAAKLCGVDRMIKLGGAQAIAALALGTESIDKVDKIFGPGNQYVTAAKQQVSSLGYAAIDMPAGPSEVLVIADSNANPAFVAADLLSQAEHGVDSQTVLISDSARLLEQTQAQLNTQLAKLPRANIAAKALANSRLILVNSLDQAVSVSNAYAPEHLIIQTQQPRSLLNQIDNAASIFIGAWTPESAGDYASGTNHVLPTYGFSRSCSALGLADFCKRFAVQEVSQQGIQNLGPSIMSLAECEGLDAHKLAVAIRLSAIREELQA